MTTTNESLVAGFCMVLVALIVMSYDLNHKLDQIIRQTCTHGESSITAFLGSDGKFHVSKPIVTSCK